VESGRLAGIKRELLSPMAIEEVRRRVLKLANARKPAPNKQEAVEKGEAEIANLTDAIAGGILKSSRALAGRLQAAERNLAKLRATTAQPPKGSVQNFLPRLVDEYRSLVDDLAASLASVNIDRARAEMRKLIGGEIQVNATADEIRLEAKQGVIDAALLRAAGQRQVLMVAGASFVCRFRPIELRKDHSRYPKCSKRHGCEQA
jgi:hypothetical protein